MVEIVCNDFLGDRFAVALIPLICVIGLGLAQGNWSLSFGATHTLNLLIWHE
ncbi:DUF389 domain-containing protein [Nostoc sp.]|uniref:DUF389 domain-containing protein n=1 Tax=Nostoc sp. TaxID=1180 RepID=UPI003FA5E60F